MFSEEGKLIVAIVLFLGGVFACGYFLGWGRDKLSIKIFDQMVYYFGKVRYWQNRYESVSADYADLHEKYRELKDNYDLLQKENEAVYRKIDELDDAEGT